MSKTPVTAEQLLAHYKEDFGEGSSMYGDLFEAVKYIAARAAPAESDQAIEPIPDNLDEPIFKLEDGSLVTGGRAASLLNDERRFHKDTLDELAAAQARIAELLSREQRLVDQFADCIDQRQKLRERVAVLEKALEGARDAFIKYEMDVEDSPPYRHRQLMERIKSALAAQPSREKEGA